jgi:hypothetical protein
VPDGDVPDVCTCGAQLPPDARFCHKCGKPQRDEPLMVEDLPPLPPPVAIPPPIDLAAPQPINFHNGQAVRIGLQAGTLAFLCSVIFGQLPLPQAFALIWLVAGGFFAVYLYKRRTGQRISILNGAHLGWICGIFGFVIVSVMLTIAAITFAEPSTVSAMREQMKTRGVPDASVNQMIEVFKSPTGIARALLVSFVLFTVLPAFGGAVGAKLLDRD